MKDCAQLWAGAGCDVPAIHDDSVAHERVGFLYVEQVNASPIFVDGGQGVGGEGSHENEDRVVVQRREAGVEVIAITIDEFERNHLNSHFGHRIGKSLDTSSRATKTIAGVDAGSVRMPEQVPVAFEKVVVVIDVDDAVVASSTPVDVKGDFTLA